MNDRTGVGACPPTRQNLHRWSLPCIKSAPGRTQGSTHLQRLRTRTRHQGYLYDSRTRVLQPLLTGGFQCGRPRSSGKKPWKNEPRRASQVLGLDRFLGKALWRPQISRSWSQGLRPGGARVRASNEFTICSLGRKHAWYLAMPRLVLNLITVSYLRQIAVP